jgi:hypothetical protein
MAVINPGGGGGAGLTQGTAAARPATPSPGQLYYATDTGEITFGNAAGNAWQAIGRITNASGLVVDAGLGGRATYTANNFGTRITSTGGATIAEAAASYNFNTNLDVTPAGSGFRAGEGSNAKQGISAAMTAGAVTVANTSITANSRIFVVRQDGGTNAGAVYVSARVVGTSFTITSTNAADTGTVAYEIFEPG